MNNLLSPDTLARTLRWSRRKRVSARYVQRGWLGGNPRYSGKSGGNADERAHKCRKGGQS